MRNAQLSDSSRHIDIDLHNRTTRRFMDPSIPIASSPKSNVDMRRTNSRSWVSRCLVTLLTVVLLYFYWKNFCCVDKNCRKFFNNHMFDHFHGLLKTATDDTSVDDINISDKNGEESQSPGFPVSPSKFPSDPVSDCSYEEHVLRELIKVKNDIASQWEIKQYPAFMDTFHVPQSSWDIQKIKFIQLLLERKYNSRRINERTSESYSTSTNTNKSKPRKLPNEEERPQREFVIGFSGSSVTAGHDNYFSEAYPNMVYKRLNELFDNVIQVPLVVRNQALGNNPCFAYDACIETHLGSDLDLLTWEQSMNCGRDIRPIDTFSRAAMHMDKKPTIVFLLSGTPQWQYQDCDTNSTDASSLSKGRSNMEKVKKTRTVAITVDEFKTRVTGSNIMSEMKFMHYAAPRNKEEQNPFSYSVLQKYKNLAPMGQNAMKIEQYKCQGPYNASFSAHTPGGGVRWHPGKLGHLLRGDSMSFLLLSILQDAITEMMNSLCGGQREAISTASDTTVTPAAYYKTVLERFKQATTGDDNGWKGPDVPPQFGIPETKYRPQCYTNFEPRVKNKLSGILHYPPSIASTMPLSVVNESSSLHPLPPTYNWNIELSRFDSAAVQKGIDMGLGYVDRKNIFVSNGFGSYATFTVTVKHSSPIWVCECQKGFIKYPPDMADINVGADLYLQPVQDFSEESLLSSAMERAHQNYTLAREAVEAVSTGAGSKSSKTIVSIKVVDFHMQCYRTDRDVEPGSYLLTVVQNSDQVVNLAYLITW